MTETLAPVLNDPRLLLAAVLGVLLLVMLLAIRAANRAGRMAQPLMQLSRRVEALGEGQERLA
ncbi:DNA recombination protein RmuC, partial [Salipiger sp. HF18]|nr:DNA recombination protein RmuC [Salipiger sp. HF18]